MKRSGDESNGAVQKKIKDTTKEKKEDYLNEIAEKDDDDLEKKINETKKELQAKSEQLAILEDLTNTLVVKERQSNDRLQAARKELMIVLTGIPSHLCTTIGIKRMGEIDKKPFQTACKERFPPSEAERKAIEIGSLWQDRLRQPHWHPFKIVPSIGGSHQELVNEDDKWLRDLKVELGIEVYETVITALKEMHAYNPSGRYAVPELWNFIEKRRATLKEVISYLGEIKDDETEELFLKVLKIIDGDEV